ncbi:MAG: cell division protein CrgA [Actinomycetota bacterium]
MPKSKTRKRSTRRPYLPAEQPVKRPRSSPSWYGYLVLGFILVGVAVIVLNYMGIMPGGTEPTWLWVGLGGIGIGFVAATQWR